MQFDFDLVFLMPHTRSITCPVLATSISVNGAVSLQQARSCLTYARFQLNSVRALTSKEVDN